MNIKVIQCVETGEYLEWYYEEYPFIGWWYLTKDISKAMVFRNTFYAIDVMKMLNGYSGCPYGRHHYVFKNVEYSNL